MKNRVFRVVGFVLIDLGLLGFRIFESFTVLRFSGVKT